MFKIIYLSFICYNLFCDNFNSFQKNNYINATSTSFSKPTKNINLHCNQFNPCYFRTPVFINTNEYYFHNFTKRVIIIIFILFILLMIICIFFHEYLEYFFIKKTLWKKDFLLKDIYENINEDPIYKKYLYINENMFNINVDNFFISNINDLLENLLRQENINFILNNNLEIHIYVQKKIYFLKNKKFFSLIIRIYKEFNLNFHIKEDSTTNKNYYYGHLLYLKKIPFINEKKINLYIFNNMYGGITDGLSSVISVFEKDKFNIKISQ
jgi:hypothetical protein